MPIIAAIVSTVIVFVSAWVWYSILFVKTWEKVAGINKNLAKKTQAQNLAYFISLTFIVSLVFAFAGPFVIVNRAILALFVWVIAGSVLAANYLFLQKSQTLLVIDLGFWLVALLEIGIIIALIS